MPSKTIRVAESQEIRPPSRKAKVSPGRNGAPLLRPEAGKPHGQSPRMAGLGAQLSADELIGWSLQKERRTSFADPSFVQTLRHLIASLNEESDLNAFGRRAARFDTIRCLTNLLRLDMAEEEHPEITSRAIDRPIFIAGLPRSGTTFLHGLLAQDGRNAMPRCWQCIYPYPSRSRLPAGDWRRARVALQLGLFRLIAPSVAELHPVAANDPQECSDITAQVFHSLRFDGMYRVPSYQNWIARRDHLDAYRFHKRFLQHLDRQEPGRRWILKSPDHVFALSAIRAIYPDALFVFVHRDPLTVLASQLNLTEALRRSFAYHVDLEEIGRDVGQAIVETANRLVATRATPGVLHLHFRSVIEAPMDAVRRIYEHAGLALTPEASQCMRWWLQRQKPYCARPHRKDLPQYGLDARSIAARFDRYIHTFDIIRTRTIIADAA